MSPIRCAVAVLAAAMPISAFAAGAADTDELRAELRTLKEDYDARIAALEARLAAAESAVAQTTVQSTTVVPATVSPTAALQEQASAATPTNPATNPTAYNPSMSLIFDGTYASLEQDPKTYQIAGFI